MDHRWRRICCAGLPWVVALAGCGGNRAAEVRDSNAEYTVRINRPAGLQTTEPGAGVQRALAFEVAGFASQEGAAEDGASVKQAAILDAFVRAMVESRRVRGETTGDFTTKIGRRVTVVHRQIGEGYEAQITLIARGVDTTFVVRDGVLQHEPHDLKLLRQVFDETNGEYALLAADWHPGLRGCNARVACYEPVPSVRMAGDPAEKTVPTP